MSINLKNPETVLEKVDAAFNYVCQIRLAFMVGDTDRVLTALDEAERLLHESVESLEAQSKQ